MSQTFLAKILISLGFLFYMKDFFEYLSKNGSEAFYNLAPLYKEYNEIGAVNESEVLRYAGIPAAITRKKCESCEVKCELGNPIRNDSDVSRGDDTYLRSECYQIGAELQDRLADTLALLKGKLTYRVAYCCARLAWDENGYPVLPFAQKSDNLKDNLSGCEGVIIFAATIGAGIDALIRRYERVEASRSLILQGAGAERVEALCDLFNEEVSRLAKEYGFDTLPRYSPGYGDLSIKVQPDLLKLVNAEKRLGISLNASYLMSPSKSVTAIIGIKRE